MECHFRLGYICIGKRLKSYEVSNVLNNLESSLHKCVLNSDVQHQKKHRTASQCVPWASTITGYGQGSHASHSSGGLIDFDKMCVSPSNVFGRYCKKLTETAVRWRYLYVIHTHSVIMLGHFVIHFIIFQMAPVFVPSFWWSVTLTVS